MAKGLDLGKQVGPLPLGGWIAVVGGGLAIGYFINRRNAVAPVEEGLPEGAGESSGAGGGQFVYDPPSTGTPDGETEPETNFTWAQKAKNYLIALPGVDAVTAANAVEKYLSGMTLTTAEQALINLALAFLGAPPEAITPTETPGGPPSGETPKPAKREGRIHITQKPSTVKAGQSFTIRAQTLVNGKNHGSVAVYVYRIAPGGSTWVPVQIAGSSPTGIVTLTRRASTKKGTERYKFTSFEPGIDWSQTTTSIKVV